MMRRALLVAALSLLAACGSGAGGTPSGVATNPANLPEGGALHSASANPNSTASAQTSGVRTVLAPLGLNLRASDSSTSQVLGTVAQGTVLTVIGHSDNNGGWYRVKGDTTAGWITSNPQFSSPHRFTAYDSSGRGFTALYLENWSFVENPNSVVFRPQTSGGQAIVVQTGPNLDALGAAGRDGYSAVSVNSVEVFGVTGVLKMYDRSGTVASPGPDSPPPLSHLAEIRLTIDASRAMRLDFAYDQGADLQEFTDFYNSLAFPPPSTASPSPSTSPGASPTPLPPGASPTPL